MEMGSASIKKIYNVLLTEVMRLAYYCVMAVEIVSNFAMSKNNLVSPSSERSVLRLNHTGHVLNQTAWFWHSRRKMTKIATVIDEVVKQSNFCWYYNFPVSFSGNDISLKR